MDPQNPRLLLEEKEQALLASQETIQVSVSYILSTEKGCIKASLVGPAGEKWEERTDKLNGWFDPLTP